MWPPEKTLLPRMDDGHDHFQYGAIHSSVRYLGAAAEPVYAVPYSAAAAAQDSAQ